MLCKSPYMVGALKPVPCTHCMPCRYNRRRLWQNRLLLESMKHAESCFLTLTYDDKHLPAGGTLVPRDVQLFMKRLRKKIRDEDIYLAGDGEPWFRKIRYYFVGEYGDNSLRPHYHAALFGVSPFHTQLVQEAWGKGHVMLGDLTPHSAQYIVGYVTKKMTAKDDPRLNGRYPEFARMSLRPGIGAVAIDDIAAVIKSPFALQSLLDDGDVPNALKIGGRSLPLSRYLRKKLRQVIGVYNINPVTGEVSHGAPKEKIHELEQKLLALYQDSQPDQEVTTQKVKSFIVKSNQTRVASMEARTKIYSARKKL